MASTNVDGSYNFEKVVFRKALPYFFSKFLESGADYGGVAITSNRLNYTGVNVQLDKLIVNDMILISPNSFLFDTKADLKEDYDAFLQNMFACGKVFRANFMICDFPHRENKGGANLYRTIEREIKCNEYVKKKWKGLLIDHKTRKDQISVNYKLLKEKLA